MQGLAAKAGALGALALACAACGGSGGSGGGGDSPSSTSPPTEVTRSVAVVGTITGFGSVVVNGAHYDTSGAKITIDGLPATQAGLRVGQVVSMKAEIGPGGRGARAIELEQEDEVRGAITSIDTAAALIVVAGQTVLIDAETSFDDDVNPGSIAGLVTGDSVEVDGFRMADGRIQATRIERGDTNEVEVEVHGFVSAIEPDRKRFRIGELTVDYANAQLDGFAGGSPQEGDQVEIEGREFASDGALLAERVEREDRDFDDDMDGAELEGLITQFASVREFEVAGHPVTTDERTVFEGGTADDLGVDVKVEVEGDVTAAGVLAARRVEIKRPNLVRITGPINSVDIAAGMLTVLGIEIVFDERTRREDHSEMDEDFFGIEDLNPGDWVEVRGHEDPGIAGRVIAALLEREEPEDEVELRARVSSVVPPQFVILGVTIDTSPDTQYEEEGGGELSAEGFFARAEGAIVEVDGSWNGTTILADEAEIEQPATGGTSPPPPSGNGAPVANAGSNLSVTAGAAVQLDGTGSSDPDNDPLSFSWLLSAPPGSAATLSAADTAQPSFVTDAAGDYRVELTVSDGQLSDSASITVTATDPAVNDPPTAVASADATTVNVGESVTLSSAGSTDPEGAALGFAWSLAVPQGSATSLSSATSPSPTFTPDTAGQYSATLRVSDGTLESAPASVAVTAQDAAPAADGAALYAANCQGCHGPINAIERMPGSRSAQDIQNAINSNKGGMGVLSDLTTTEIAAIAAAIAAANP